MQLWTPRLLPALLPFQFPPSWLTQINFFSQSSSSKVACTKWTVRTPLSRGMYEMNSVRTGSFTCHCGNTGVERTPNKSQHTKLTLEKKILLPLLPGFELAIFRSRVVRSTKKLFRNTTKPVRKDAA